jgi:hypothetical protein
VSLTGWPLATVLLIGALLLLVPLALGLPSHRGWRSALARVSQLGLFTVLVLGLVGWGVNRNENLFGTWTDLYRYATGNAPPPATKTIGGKPAVAAPAPSTSSPSAEPVPDLPPLPSEVRGTSALQRLFTHARRLDLTVPAAPAPPALPPLPSPAGRRDAQEVAASAPPDLPPLPSSERFQQVKYTGPRSGLTGAISLHLPAGYDPKAATPYPVIVAFYGFPGAYTGFTDPANMDYTNQLDAAVAAHRIRAPIVVIPQVHWNGIDSECVDGPQGNVYTWMTADLPQWITGHLRVATGRESWATTGYSAGG